MVIPNPVLIDKPGGPFLSAALIVPNIPLSSSSASICLSSAFVAVLNLKHMLDSQMGVVGQSVAPGLIWRREPLGLIPPVLWA